MPEELPKIREDPDTGKRYIRVDGKKIWLAKGVTQKDLVKFLLKRAKRKTTKKKGKKSTRKKTKRRSTTKKKTSVTDSKPAGEATSRSVFPTCRRPRHNL